VDQKLPSKKKGPAVPKKDSADAAAGPGTNNGEPAGKKAGKAVKAAAKKSAVPAKAKAAKPAKPAAKKKAPAARPVRRGIQFICSECYEEFVLPADYSRETVTCPECLHVGKRPAEDFLRTVNLHKTGEKKALLGSVNISVMLATVSLIFVYLLSPYSENLSFFAKDPGQRSTAALVAGVAVVILVGLLSFSISKYERNRWEIYF